MNRQQAILTPKRVFQLIDTKRNRPWNGEEEVRIAWVSALEAGLGIHFDAERARKDSSYNNVIIEFKAPGLFKGTKSSAKFKEATEDRLYKYILKSAKKQKIKKEDYIGIAIDGEHICFIQLKEKHIETGHLLPFSPESVAMVMEACLHNYRRAISSDNLIEDFGHTSPVAINLMQSLSNSLAINLSSQKTSKIQMLFEEWRTLYGQVADLSIEQEGNIDKSLKFKWIGPLEYKISGRLFVIHSYNSIIIKLLAAQIISAHGLSSRKNPAEEMVALLTTEDLFEMLKNDIERGLIFSEAGINGFVEEVIFSWYLDAYQQESATSGIISCIKEILASIVLYRTDYLSHTRDVLRDFYQGLVPEVLRKSLGEFYTPDWLVDFTIEKLNPSDWLKTRALDPTCGSGSFLIALIRKKKEAAKSQNLSPKKVLDILCQQVWGFDLNPLAVQTARVNFLMEIADLMKQSPGEQIEIPVLLADAIYSPARDPNDDEEIVKYSIGSQVAKLNITLPAQLAFDRQRLDKVFEKMANSVEDEQPYVDIEDLLVKSNLITDKEIQDWSKPLKLTYEQVLALHKKNWNGIWFKIVRNFFWSATAGQFDIIVGNPPWVRWSKLPNAYRERVKPTCEQYDIFSNTPHHGGNELDISAMITYTVSDKWLNVGGKLAFVITQTVFQNPSSSGFRGFNIDGENYLTPISVDDMKTLKPFPDATNKTAIALFEKSKNPPQYPINYNTWYALPGYRKKIDPSLTLSKALEGVDFEKMEAHQVGESGSPWAILGQGRMDIIKTLVGKSDWISGRKGITADLNGIFFVSIVSQNNSSKNPLVQIQTRPHAGRTNIGTPKKIWVEPDLLFPLIKGARDFSECYFSPNEPLYAFVPNKGIKQEDYLAIEDEIENTLPKTKGYFTSFKKLLEKRSTWRTRMPNAPYYAIYNVGDFTFKPWKVIWAEMASGFSAAVAGLGNVPSIGKRPYVPDHKIYFIALDEKKVAYYLCGLLNSEIVKEYVQSHNVSIQVGDIFKHMSLPPYDHHNHLHNKISSLVEKAHQEDNDGDRMKLIKKVKKIGNEILTEWADTRLHKI